MENNIEKAKRILLENKNVRYGIFGMIENSGYFPPLGFLNEFFMKGSDPCDQDQRMGRWPPFQLSIDEYAKIRDWWVSLYPDAIEDALDQNSWDDWVALILEENRL
jgi:hypothetical protein